MPQWQDRYRGLRARRARSGRGRAAESRLGPQASTGGSAAATPARPYGRILIFTLLDDRVADFDRLAEQTAEEVRIGEPDTLVYVIHLVPNAPMQRIFYEIYRDRAAFDSHEAQPYMQRFVAERRSCVLATNVIELRLKYAKVAPLPNPQASVPPPPGVPAGPAPAAQAQLPPGPRTAAVRPARRRPGASGGFGTAGNPAASALAPAPAAAPGPAAPGLAAPRPAAPRPAAPRPAVA